MDNTAYFTSALEVSTLNEALHLNKLEYDMVRCYVVDAYTDPIAFEFTSAVTGVDGFAYHYNIPNDVRLLSGGYEIPESLGNDRFFLGLYVRPEAKLTIDTPTHGRYIYNAWDIGLHNMLYPRGLNNHDFGASGDIIGDGESLVIRFGLSGDDGWYGTSADGWDVKWKNLRLCGDADTENPATGIQVVPIIRPFNNEAGGDTRFFAFGCPSGGEYEPFIDSFFSVKNDVWLNGSAADDPSGISVTFMNADSISGSNTTINLTFIRGGENGGAYSFSTTATVDVDDLVCSDFIYLPSSLEYKNVFVIEAPNGYRTLSPTTLLCHTDALSGDTEYEQSILEIINQLSANGGTSSFTYEIGGRFASEKNNIGETEPLYRDIVDKELYYIIPSEPGKFNNQIELSAVSATIWPVIGLGSQISAYESSDDWDNGLLEGNGYPIKIPFSDSSINNKVGTKKYCMTLTSADAPVDGGVMDLNTAFRFGVFVIPSDEVLELSSMYIGETWDTITVDRVSAPWGDVVLETVDDGEYADVLVPGVGGIVAVEPFIFCGRTLEDVTGTSAVVVNSKSDSIYSELTGNFIGLFGGTVCFSDMGDNALVQNTVFVNLSAKKLDARVPDEILQTYLDQDVSRSRSTREINPLSVRLTNIQCCKYDTDSVDWIDAGSMRADMEDYYGDEPPCKHGMTLQSILKVPIFPSGAESITMEEYNNMAENDELKYTRIELNSIPTYVAVSNLTYRGGGISTENVTAYDSDTGSVIYPDSINDDQVIFFIPRGSYTNLFFAPTISMADVIANVEYDDGIGNSLIMERPLKYIVYDETRFSLNINPEYTHIDTKGEIIRATVTVDISCDGVNLAQNGIKTEDSQLDIQWDVFFGSDPDGDRVLDADGLTIGTMDVDVYGNPIGSIEVCGNGGWGHRSARISFNNTVNNISGKTLVIRASLVMPDRSNWSTTGKYMTNINCYAYANVQPFERPGYDFRLWLPDYVSVIPDVDGNGIYDYYRPLPDNSNQLIYGMRKRNDGEVRKWYDKCAIIYNGRSVYNGPGGDSDVDLINSQRYIIQTLDAYREKTYTFQQYEDMDGVDIISENGDYRYVLITPNGSRYERDFTLRFVPSAAYNELDKFVASPEYYYVNQENKWHKVTENSDWLDSLSASPSAYVTDVPMNYLFRATGTNETKSNFYYHYAGMNSIDGIPGYEQIYPNTSVVDDTVVYTGTITDVNFVGQIDVYWQKNYSPDGDTEDSVSLVGLPLYRWKFVTANNVDVPTEIPTLNLGCSAMIHPPTAINPFDMLYYNSDVSIYTGGERYPINDTDTIPNIKLDQPVVAFSAEMNIDESESFAPIVVDVDRTTVRWLMTAYTNDGLNTLLWGPANDTRNPSLFNLTSDYSPELLYHVAIGTSTSINLNVYPSYAIGVKSSILDGDEPDDHFDSYIASLTKASQDEQIEIHGQFNVRTIEDISFYTETPIIKKNDPLVIIDGNDDEFSPTSWPYTKYTFAIGDFWSDTWVKKDDTPFTSIAVPSGVLSAVGAYSLSVTACQNIECTGTALVKDIPNFVNVTLVGNVYDDDMFREFSDVELVFPYSENKLWMPPNEWLTATNFNLMIDRLQTDFNYLIKNSMYYNKSPMSIIGKVGDYRFLGMRRFGTNRDISSNPMITTGNTIENARDIFVDYNDRLMYIANGSNVTIIDMYSESHAKKADILVGSVGIEYDKVDAVVVTSHGDILALIGDSNRVLGFGAYNGADNDAKCQYLFEFGDLGGRSARGKFNAPTDMAIDSDDVVYILDAGNRCIKKMTYTGSWIATIVIPDELFGDTDTAKSICVNSYGIFVLVGEVIVRFNQSGEVVDVWPLVDTKLTSLKIRSMADLGYMYVVYDTVVVKYSHTGGRSSRIHMDQGGFRSAAYSSNGSLMLLHDTYADCCVDGLVKHSITSDNYINKGLLWSLEDIYVKPNENIQDMVVNTSLQRFYDNVRIFTNSIMQHLRYEENDRGEPMFSVYDFDVEDIRNATADIKDQIFVGINELVTSDVINRCVSKIYDYMNKTLNMMS